MYVVDNGEADHEPTELNVNEGTQIVGTVLTRCLLWRGNASLRFFPPTTNIDDGDGDGEAHGG
jgi:hypothetical protein